MARTAFLVVAGLVTVARLTAIDVGAPASVTIFPTGVAEFTHTIELSGAGELELTVERAHMADVVRTLTVVDPAGDVADVSFSGGTSADDQLSRYRFDLGGVDSLADLARQARGAEVSVGRTRDTPLSGTLIGADDQQILIATAGGVERIEIERAGALTFENAETQTAFEVALDALARVQTDGKRRTLTIRTAAGGARTVELRYLSPSPMWRVSYRAVAHADGALRLQGWAHVDNAGAIDWSEVELTLVSAEPVTLADDLYTPRYPARSSGTGGRAPQAFAESAPSMARSAMDDADFSSAPAIPTGSGFVGQEGTDGFSFTLPQPVTLAAGRSAMVPLVDQIIDARRVRVWDPRQDGNRARAAFEIENTTELQLPPGPITIFEAGRYVGDSRLELMVEGADATISFARDLELRITQRGRSEVVEVTRIRIVDGLLLTERRARRTVTYEVDWGASEVGSGAPVVVTHYVSGGWDVVEPPAFRDEHGSFELEIDGESARVTEEQIREQRVALTSVDIEQLALFADNRLLDPVARRVVANVAELRRVVAEAVRVRSELERERAQIVNDQQRVRNNMSALSRDSSLYRRYERDLSSSEDRHERVERELEGAREEEAAAREALTAYLRTLD